MAEVAKPESERDPNRVQRFRQAVERLLDYLNHELDARQFLATEFSVADIGFAPRLAVLSRLGIEAGSGRPNVDGWIRRLLERPSIQGLQGVSVDPVLGA